MTVLKSHFEEFFLKYSICICVKIQYFRYKSPHSRLTRKLICPKLGQGFEPNGCNALFNIIAMNSQYMYQNVKIPTGRPLPYIRYIGSCRWTGYGF